MRAVRRSSSSPVVLWKRASWKPTPSTASQQTSGSSRRKIRVKAHRARASDHPAPTCAKYHVRISRAADEWSQPVAPGEHDIQQRHRHRGAFVREAAALRLDRIEYETDEVRRLIDRRLEAGDKRLADLPEVGPNVCVVCLEGRTREQPTRREPGDARAKTRPQAWRQTPRRRSKYRRHGEELRLRSVRAPASRDNASRVPV